jgi:hypothetical protein
MLFVFESVFVNPLLAKLWILRESSFVPGKAKLENPPAAYGINKHWI